MTSSKISSAPCCVVMSRQELKEARICGQATAVAEHWLENDSGNVATLFCESAFDHLPVVPFDGHGFVIGPLACADGDGLPLAASICARVGLVAYEHAVIPTVIVPFEFQILSAPGGSAGKAQRDLYDLCSAIGESDLISAGNVFCEKLGDFKFKVVLGTEGVAEFELRGYSLIDWLGGMPENQGTPGECVIDVAVVIDIGDARALA